MALLVVAFPLSVFTYRLETNPPGFFIDESIYGFEAHTILKTKGFSAAGLFLPRLFDHGNGFWGHGVYTYLVVPFVGLLGMKETSVRLASVCASIALLGLLLVLLRGKVSGWSMLLAALWWPLMSWVFLLSRTGMEFMATVLLSTALMWLLLKIQSSERVRDLHLLLFDVAVTMLFFIYPAGKVLAPGYILLGLAMLFRKRAPVAAMLKLVASALLILVLALPYIRGISALSRADNVVLKCTKGVLYCLARNVASHFDPRSYFANSYKPPDFPVVTHSIAGTSLVPRALAPFLAIGLIAWLRRLWKKEFFAGLLLAFVILGIIPASLTIRGFDSYRSVPLLPILFILIVFGIDVCVQAARGLPGRIETAFLACFLFGTLYFGYGELKAAFAYEYNVDAALKTGYHYGYREVFDYFVRHYDEYDAFVVTENAAYVPNLYIRFYDPDGVYGKIRVGKVADKVLPAVDGASKVLYAVRPDEVDIGQFMVRKTVYYLSGRDVAFQIGETRPPDTGSQRGSTSFQREVP